MKLLNVSITNDVNIAFEKLKKFLKVNKVVSVCINFIYLTRDILGRCAGSEVTDEAEEFVDEYHAIAISLECLKTF